MASLVHKAMGFEESSLEALLTSMEYEEVLPIRPYCCVVEE